MLALRREEVRVVDLTAAFYELYQREADVVLRYLRSSVRQPALAEDLCADAFCRAWDAWPRFHGSAAEARAWLLRIARNLVIDAVRRDGRVKLVALADSQPGHIGMSTAPELMDLRRAMDALGRDDRELLALRMAGLSHAEVAHVQGRSEEAVKKAWQRALGRLRSQLEVPA